MQWSFTKNNSRVFAALFILLTSCLLFGDYFENSSEIITGVTPERKQYQCDV